MKKLLALLLAALMIVSMFAGCGQKPEEPAEPAEPSVEEPAEPTEEPAEKPAEEAEGPVEIDWYLGCPMPQEKQDDVFNAINEILIDELNIKVNFHLVAFSEYGQKMQIVLSSGEPVDMMWTSNWTNDFYADAAKNAYLPLDMEMIKEYGPCIMEAVPEGAWGAGVVNGQQLAIPNVQVLARWPAVCMQTKFMEKYNIDPASVQSFDDLTPIIEQIAANDKDYYATPLYKGTPILSGIISALGLEYFGESHPFGIRIADEDPQIINIYETEEMRGFLDTLRTWYEAGYTRPDAASVTDISAEIASGKIAWEFGVNNPDTAVNEAARMGLEAGGITMLPISDPYLNTSTIVASMNAINVNSTKAKECIQVLNKFFDPEDTRVFNLLSFGIEGVNYTRVEGEDDLITLIPDSGYTYNCGWAYGNMFNTFRTDASQPKWRPMGPDINANAQVSPILGFSFDPTPVKGQIAQIAAVMNEYIPALQTGSVDVDSTLADLMEKLDAAGADELQAEMQAQLDAWKATK